MFKKIHDAFEPVYDRSADDSKVSFTERPVYVREDDPGAWGETITIPAGAFYRIPPDDWQQNTNPYPVTACISMEGSRVYVETVNDAGEREQILYIGVAD